MKKVTSFVLLALACCLLAGCFETTPTSSPTPAQQDAGISGCLADYAGVLPLDFTAAGYAAVNPDLADVLCTDGACDSEVECAALADHYISAGASEGRPYTVVNGSSTTLPISSIVTSSAQQPSSSTVSLTPATLSLILDDVSGWENVSNMDAYYTANGWSTPAPRFMYKSGIEYRFTWNSMQIQSFDSHRYMFSGPVDFSAVTECLMDAKQSSGTYPMADLLLVTNAAGTQAISMLRPYTDSMERQTLHYNPLVVEKFVLNPALPSQAAFDHYGVFNYSLSQIYGVYVILRSQSNTYTTIYSFSCQ